MESMATFSKVIIGRLKWPSTFICYKNVCGDFVSVCQPLEKISQFKMTLIIPIVIDTEEMLLPIHFNPICVIIKI